MSVSLLEDHLDSPPRTWKALLALPLEDLRRLPLLSSRPESPLAFYGQALRDYLLGRDDELVRALDPTQLGCGGLWERSANLARLRWAVRAHEVTPALIESIQKAWTPEERSSASDIEFFLLNAECDFVVAQAFERLGRFAEAAESFVRSGRGFAVQGVFAKACRARQNAIANLSCEDPNRDCVAEYLDLADYAMKVGEKSTAAICHLNVSRERQRSGRLSEALLFSKTALKLLSAESGTLNSSLAIVHHADLLGDLNRLGEARELIAQLQASPFPEIQETLKVLALKLDLASSSTLDSSKLLPTWRERLSALIEARDRERKALQKNLEQRLVQLLRLAPLDKFDLVEKLYGNSKSFFVFENRLKNLLNRVRHRYPDALVFRDGKYFFMEESFDGELR